MKEEILGYILGNLTLGFLAAFYLFAVLGIILSMLLHIGKKAKKAPIKFSFKYWIKDNVTRFFTSIICIFIAIRFYDSLPIDVEPNMFFGLVVGMGLDQIIIIIRNKTNINLFQKK